jgi:hypothetical protein
VCSALCGCAYKPCGLQPAGHVLVSRFMYFKLRCSGPPGDHPCSKPHLCNTDIVGNSCVCHIQAKSTDACHGEPIGANRGMTRPAECGNGAMCCASARNASRGIHCSYWGQRGRGDLHNTRTRPSEHSVDRVRRQVYKAGWAGTAGCASRALSHSSASGVRPCDRTSGRATGSASQAAAQPMPDV